MEGARKRRKWDVASPGGMPLAGNRAGIGAGGTGQSGLSGFITAQGQKVPSVPNAAAATHPLAAAAAAAASQPGAGHKPNQSIDQATIARAQQGAQAIVERINAVRQGCIQSPFSVAFIVSYQHYVLAGAPSKRPASSFAGSREILR